LIAPHPDLNERWLIQPRLDAIDGKMGTRLLPKRYSQISSHDIALIYQERQLAANELLVLPS
jgi:hypothetical protein